MTVHRDIGQLSDREQQILRMLAHGHDAKSAARMLDVSIHTVNERLRDARRKLGVSSSREAARLLLSAEGYEEQISGNEEMGFVSPTVQRVEQAPPTLQVGKRLPLVTGAFLMVLTALIAMGAYALGQHAAVEQATSAPKVVATTPKSGAVIAPGPLVLSVTFDQAMQDQSFSFVQDPPRPFPKDCQWPAQLSMDRRTYSVRCVAVPQAHYGVWFNREPYMNFRSEKGVAAEPHPLLFRTRQH